MSGLDIAQAFRFAMDRVKANPVFFLLAPIVAMIAGAIVAFIATFLGSLLILGAGALLKLPHFASEFATQIFSTIVQVAISSPILLGMYKGYKKDVEAGPAEFMDVFSGFSGLGLTPALGLGLAANLPLAVIAFALTHTLKSPLAILALALPVILVAGLLLGSFYSLSMVFVAEGETASLGAPAFFKALAKWSPAYLILCFVATLAAGIIGLLCCCIGLLVTMPFAAIICWHLGRQAIGDTPGQAAPAVESAPESGAGGGAAI